MRVLRLGRQQHERTSAAMAAFTAARSTRTSCADDDELWLVEHAPVFTQGLAGRAEHVRDAGGIPVVASNRGGQVTYHGPGQVVAYPLVDLKRLRIYVREYVFRLEEALLGTLVQVGVSGHRVRGAPGIYVRPDDPFGHAVQGASGGDPAARFDGLAKIAAIGVKVSNHRTSHGLALNVAMDLSPFARIDPCGYPGLATTDLQSLGVAVSWDEAAELLAGQLVRRLA